MDLLSNDEPLINLNGYGSEDHDLLNEESRSQNQRRRNASRHNNSGSLINRQNRLSSGSKLYLRELSPVKKEQGMDRYNSAIVSAVERTMKNYADGVLRVLEGMSGRLSQLESTTQDLEQSVASLKLSVEDYHENTDRNFKILSERIKETHRAVHILRDKQDIFEAHAALAKLQTSKVLVEKESTKPVGMTMDSMDPTNIGQQQEHPPQVQSQQSLQHSQQLVPSQQPFLSTQQPTHQQSPQLLPLQQPSQHLSPSQQLMPQSQPLMLAQQYQVPSVLSQHPGVPLEVSVNQLDQAHYQGTPQQMQLQQMLPQVTSSPQPLQVTTKPSSQTARLPEHVRYLPPSSQMQVLPHLHQQTPGQQPTPAMLQLPVPTQFQQQRQIQEMPPPPIAQLPTSLQQSSQPQQQPLQGPPPPPLMQQVPTSQPQGSFQYYGQSSDTWNYAPGMPSFVPSGNILENSQDPSNHNANQHLYSTTPAQQPSHLQSIQRYGPQIPQSSEHNAGNVWNRHSSPMPPRLRTGQPVHVEAGSPEVNVIVEKVAAMGFSREQVQNVIRRLAERNQAIDMNIVLDTLMNGGFAR